MLRSTLILLHLAIMLINTQAFLGKIWEFEPIRANVSVTTVDSMLYAVSKNQTHISIQSNVTSYQRCDLEFRNSHMGKINVAGIEGKILLLLRLNSKIIQMLQLDPVLCLYTPLPNLEISGTSSLEPQLIVLDDTVDVFVKNDITCHPCRLDINGNRLDVTGQLKESQYRIFESFIVKEFIQKGVVRNYVLAGNYDNGTSILIVLDHNFNRIKDKYFKYHQIEALAANSVSNENLIGITYAGFGSPHERVLAMYTNDLELLYEIRVKKHKNGDRIISTLLSINSIGQACVNSQQKSPSSDYRYFNYAIYNLEGQLIENKAYYNLRLDINDHWQLLPRNDGFCYAFHWEDKSALKTAVHCYSE